MLVVVLLSSLVLVGTASKVAFKASLASMAPFAILVSLLNALGLIPISAVAYLISRIASRHSSVPGGSSQAFPWMQAVSVAVADVTAMILHGLPSSYLSVPMLILLGQAKVPFSMGLSIALLGARYTRAHYAGAALILVGIFIATYPSIGMGPLMWNILYCMSSLPAALSHVLREKAVHKSPSLSPLLFNLVVSCVAVVFFLPMLVPASWLLHDMDIAQVIIDGVGCAVFGRHPSGSAACATAPLATASYMVLSGMYNVLVLLTITFGSAALVALGSTIVLPLSNIALATPAIMGSYAARLSVFDLAALLVIMAGATVFRVASGTPTARHAGKTD